MVTNERKLKEICDRIEDIERKKADLLNEANKLRLLIKNERWAKVIDLCRIKNIKYGDVARAARVSKGYFFAVMTKGITPKREVREAISDVLGVPSTELWAAS